MSAPVLEDLAGRLFTEDDYVVYSGANGIRYGRVDWIKDTTDPDPRVNAGRQTYKIYIDLDFHRGLDKKPGKMYVRRMGYDYTPRHFLKVSELTD